MIETNDVITLLQTYYELEPQAVTAVTTKAYQVTCSQKTYLFKIAKGSDEFLVKQLQAYRALPKHILPIYKTVTNAYCIRLEDDFCYLTDYIYQIPMPIEKKVMAYGDILQQLHEKTNLEVEIKQAELTQIYQTQYNQLQASYDQLQKAMQEYELKPERSPYEWYFMMVYPMLYGILQRAHEELKRFYDKVQKESKLPVSLVHLDVNLANVMASEQATYVINFEKSQFTFGAIDMCLFLENYHHVQGIKPILLAYLKKEEAIMKHFFFFKTLTFDVDELQNSLTKHSLTNIALLNERLAPHMLALQLYDAINTPTTTTQG